MCSVILWLSSVGPCVSTTDTPNPEIYLVNYVIREVYIHHIFSEAAVEMRNIAVYDEVDLPPTTSSLSIIPTEPNTDYVTTTMSQTPPITTHHNMAYGNI